VFDVPKGALKDIIVAHGGYAHGTIKENGKITAETLDEAKEYAIRPSFGSECWKKLGKFRVKHDELPATDGVLPGRVEAHAIIYAFES